MTNKVPQNLREGLSSLGFAPKDFGNYFRMKAIYRQGSNPLALCVDKSTGNFRDFGAFSPYPTRGSWTDLQQLVGKTCSSVSFCQSQEEPEKFMKKVEFPIEMLKRLVPMWDFYTERGISSLTMKLFQSGMAMSGKLSRRICFPVFNQQGKIIGFAGRWYKKETPNELTPKWKLISPKSEFVYPCHLNRPNELGIILVESIGCVVRLKECGIDNAFCLFGTSLGAGLLKYLISENPNNIFISTNNEPENNSIGNLAAEKIQKKLNKFFDSSKIHIELPTDKDFFAMTNEAVTEWYQNLQQNYAPQEKIDTDEF